MLAVDTNILVRLLARDDVKQAKLADLFVANGAWVSHLVLAETLWVLKSAYNRSPSQLTAVLDILLAHESLVLQDADTVSAALTHFQSNPALGFSNCLVLEIARKAGHIPLGTFDKAFSMLANVQKL